MSKITVTENDLEPVDGERESDLGAVDQLQPRRPRRRRSLLPWVIILVIVALVGGALYMFNERRELQREVAELSQKQNLSAIDESKQLLEEVGQLIELPTDDEPTIATVSDASKVNDKPFFANAKNDDKVLLFTKSGKAILYRPSIKKIIEVSTLNLSAPGETTPVTTP